MRQIGGEKHVTTAPVATTQCPSCRHQKHAARCGEAILIVGDLGYSEPSECGCLDYVPGPSSASLPAAAPSSCRSCGAPVVWIETARGKRMPQNPDGTSHFASCPDAAKWRKGKAERGGSLYDADGIDGPFNRGMAKDASGTAQQAPQARPMEEMGEKPREQEAEAGGEARPGERPEAQQVPRPHGLTLSHSSPLGGAGSEVPGAATSPAALISTLFWESKRKRVKVSGPAPNTRASSLGNECERALFYERTVPASLRKPHTPETQAIFDLGVEMQRIVIRELEDAGIQIVQTERDYEDRRLRLSAHVDALIRVPGWSQLLSAEIKGLNPHAADTIKTIDDIRRHRQEWIRKYFAQLQTYLFFTEREMGVFLLKNKSTGALTPIECRLDYEYVEGLLQKAERIQLAVDLNVAPPRNTGERCEKCPFLSVCGPDREFGPGAAVVDDGELEALLVRREALRGPSKDYEDVDAAVKAKLPKRPEVVVGPFVAKGAEVTRGKKPHWQWKEIARIGGTKP